MKKASVGGKKPVAAGGWVGRRVDRLSAPDIQALLAGEIPYISVPRYLSPEWCLEIVRRFEAARPEDHDYGITKIRTIGMSLVGFIKSGTPTSGYFDRVQEIVTALRGIYRGGEDPVQKLRQDLVASMGWECFEAQENGRSYASDIISALPPGFGLPLHCDSAWALPGMLVSRIPFLLSWNVYLSPADEGGKLVIYRRRPSAQDEDARMHQGRLQGSLVEGIEKAEFAPSRGDFILFNSADYHEVEVSKGASHRITSHSWISADPAAKKFAFWN
jgi:hypothetical protein